MPKRTGEPFIFPYDDELASPSFDNFKGFGTIGEPKAALSLLSRATLSRTRKTTQSFEG